MNYSSSLFDVHFDKMRKRYKKHDAQNVAVETFEVFKQREVLSPAKNCLLMNAEDSFNHPLSTQVTTRRSIGVAVAHSGLQAPLPVSRTPQLKEVEKRTWTTWLTERVTTAVVKPIFPVKPSTGPR